MKRIVLTGGGTAGHVTPNIALIPKLKDFGYEIHYIGSYEGIEKELLKPFDITYHGISSGKLRRYFSLQNFTDPFRVLVGFVEARRIIKKIKPNILFSKGGFVTVPVVVAGKAHKVPVITHESDMTPGLANKLAFPSATKICCNFPETLKFLPGNKGVLTGSPIRKEMFEGNKNIALQMCGFTDQKPVILILGGSLGSVVVNTAIRRLLPEILEGYQIIHLCGKGKIDTSLTDLQGYAQFEYLQSEYKDVIALADLVISRAGANAICELLALYKPNLLVPLSLKASRGDQILNAKSFEKQGFSMVLEEENLTKESLYESIEALHNNKDQYIKNMKASNQKDGVTLILNLIEELHKETPLVSSTRN
jgi:UDP-N-acetylglucosamine--N-acetylmuramyl-(pentapeptide) pyrophosphoryl-undecaprenol N-acetylglucosamine transferase